MKDYFLFLSLLLKPKKFLAVTEVDGLLAEFDNIIFFMLLSVILSLSICIVGFVTYLDTFGYYFVLIPLFFIVMFVVYAWYFSSNSMYVLIWFYIFFALFCNKGVFGICQFLFCYYLYLYFLNNILYF